MFRMILLTIMGLFGVLAVYGTPEMAGGNPVETAQAVPEMLQTVVYRVPEPDAAPAQIPAAELLALAMKAAPAVATEGAVPLLPSPEHASSPSVDEGATGVRIKGNRVNMRSTPASTGAVVASLSNGTSVTPHGSMDGDWIEVSAGPRRGFVAARFVVSGNPG